MTITCDYASTFFCQCKVGCKIVFYEWLCTHFFKVFFLRGFRSTLLIWQICQESSSLVIVYWSDAWPRRNWGHPATSSESRKLRSIKYGQRVERGGGGGEHNFRYAWGDGRIFGNNSRFFLYNYFPVKAPSRMWIISVFLFLFSAFCQL